MNPREYAVYVNRRSPRLRIHGPGCSQIKKRGGIHRYEQSGEWAFFAEEDESREYAKTMSEKEHIRNAEDCWYCKRRNRL